MTSPPQDEKAHFCFSELWRNCISLSFRYVSDGRNRTRLFFDCFVAFPSNLLYGYVLVSVSVAFTFQRKDLFRNPSFSAFLIIIILSFQHCDLLSWVCLVLILALIKILTLKTDVSMSLTSLSKLNKSFSVWIMLNSHFRILYSKMRI